MIDENRRIPGSDTIKAVVLAAPSCSSYMTGEILPILGGDHGG